MHSIITRTLPYLCFLTVLHSCSSASNGDSQVAPSSVPGTPVVNNNAPSRVNATTGFDIPMNLSKLTMVGQDPNIKRNPAHGQPGHRCDIAVGAPLETTSTPTQPLIPGQQAQASVAAAEPSVANGLNPAHGQPGHRCDIAVGAPLNSKPAPVQTTVAQPAVTTVQQPQIEIKPGMNPYHGQPGHRCDIAVGAPLNSKPATPSAPKPQNSTSAADTSGRP